MDELILLPKSKKELLAAKREAKEWQRQISSFPECQREMLSSLHGNANIEGVTSGSFPKIDPPPFQNENFDCRFCHPENFKDNFSEFSFFNSFDDFVEVHSHDSEIETSEPGSHFDGLSEDTSGFIEAETRPQSLREQALAISPPPPKPKPNISLGNICRHQNWCDWTEFSKGEGICQIQIFPDKYGETSIDEIDEFVKAKASMLQQKFDEGFTPLRNVKSVHPTSFRGGVSYGYQANDDNYEYWKIIYDWEYRYCYPDRKPRRHYPTIAFRYMNLDPYKIIHPSEFSKVFRKCTVKCEIVQSPAYTTDIDLAWFGKKKGDSTSTNVIVSIDPSWKKEYTSRTFLFDRRLYCGGKILMEQSQEMSQEFQTEIRLGRGSKKYIHHGKGLNLIAQCDQQFPEEYLCWNEWATRPPPSLRRFIAP